jgi:GNAT superfamily N-acetyltransferase
MTAFTLLPASESDKDFIFDAFKTAMREYVEWAWGWNEEFQRDGFWANLPVQKFTLICVDGHNAGALYVEESAQNHWVRTLFLRPEFQGQGVGSAVLAQETARASAAYKPLALKVIKINPAKRLYDRMGFKVVREDEATFHMQWG